MDRIVHTQPNTTLLKEPGPYCFLLRCKRIEAEPFIEWVVKTVLPHEIRKLSKQLSNQQKEIEGKDAALALLTDDLQGRDNQIQAIQYENVALQAQKDVYQGELLKCQDTIIHLKTRYVPHARNPGKDNIIIIYGNVQHQPMINIMTCHIVLREYNNVKGMLN